MRTTLACTLLTLTSIGFAADEVAPAPAPAPLPPAPVPAASPWSTKGRLGAFFNNSSTMNADVSRDATIGGSGRTTSTLFTGDLDVQWQDGKNSAQHIFKGRYGRQKTNDEPLVENQDEARYDGVFRHELAKPHFIYLAWGLESVWTGPYKDDPTLPPDNSRNPFDPLLAKLSAGYGQRYADWQPNDTFEWRLGVRAQKRWGSQLTEDQRGIETGPEAFIRYEATPLKYQKDLKYFAQYEGFSEFNDLQHITNLITAGLTFQLSKYINLELALRAYYETRPKEDRDDQLLAGYNQWSIKQDTLLGVVYNF